MEKKQKIKVKALSSNRQVKKLLLDKRYLIEDKIILKKEYLVKKQLTSVKNTKRCCQQKHYKCVFSRIFFDQLIVR